MNQLRAVNRLSRWPRRGLKCLFLLVVLVAVTYPRPRLLVRAIQHSRDMQALIDPDCPALQSWLDELHAGFPPDPDEATPVLFARVERFVREKVPYDWDWNTWGVMDYAPTVAEVIDKGREDCDGRAIMAASLVKALGYEPRLVTDLKHVWVWTPQGEFMGPSGAKVFEPTEAGSRFNWRSLRNVPTNLAFGLAVYPLGRELVMVLSIWICGWRPGARMRILVPALFLLGLGLMVIRLSAWDHRNILHWGVWLGWGGILAGLAAMCLMSRPART